MKPLGKPSFLHTLPRVVIHPAIHQLCKRPYPGHTSSARKVLQQRISNALQCLDIIPELWGLETTPEAMSVNVTKTMRLAGVRLQWPPETTVKHVALIGRLIKYKERTNANE